MHVRSVYVQVLIIYLSLKYIATITNLGKLCNIYEKKKPSHIQTDIICEHAHAKKKYKLFFLKRRYHSDNQYLNNLNFKNYKY